MSWSPGASVAEAALALEKYSHIRRTAYAAGAPSRWADAATRRLSGATAVPASTPQLARLHRRGEGGRIRVVAGVVPVERDPGERVQPRVVGVGPVPGEPPGHVDELEAVRGGALRDDRVEQVRPRVHLLLLGDRGVQQRTTDLGREQPRVAEDDDVRVGLALPHLGVDGVEQTRQNGRDEPTGGLDGRAAGLVRRRQARDDRRGPPDVVA